MPDLHPQQLRNVRLLLLPLGLIVVLVGASFAFDNFSNIAQHKGSSTWATVQGRIVRSEQADARVADVQSCPTPVVEYEYSVDDKQFRSRRISFSKISSCDRSYTRTILREFSTDKMVAVFYNPAAPEQAVLKTEGTVGSTLGSGSRSWIRFYRRRIGVCIVV